MPEAPQWNDMQVSRREKREPTRRDLIQSLGPWALIGGVGFLIAGFVIDMTIGARMQMRRSRRARWRSDEEANRIMNEPPPTHVPPVPLTITGAIAGACFAVGSWYMQKETWKADQKKEKAREKKRREKAKNDVHPLFQKKDGA